MFVLGALIVREIPPLADQVQGILDFARQGNLPVVLAVTAISGVGEEVFFRGAVYSVFARWHPVAVSVALYTLATVATANIMLVFAAAVLSVVWGLQRRASGGVLAPILTHITWSLTMARGAAADRSADAGAVARARGSGTADRPMGRAGVARPIGAREPARINSTILGLE